MVRLSLPSRRYAKLVTSSHLNATRPTIQYTWRMAMVWRCWTLARLHASRRFLSASEGAKLVFGRREFRTDSAREALMIRTGLAHAITTSPTGVAFAASSSQPCRCRHDTVWGWVECRINELHFVHATQVQAECMSHVETKEYEEACHSVLHSPSGV